MLKPCTLCKHYIEEIKDPDSPCHNCFPGDANFEPRTSPDECAPTAIGQLVDVLRDIARIEAAKTAVECIAVRKKLSFADGNAYDTVTSLEDIALDVVKKYSWEEDHDDNRS